MPSAEAPVIAVLDASALLAFHHMGDYAELHRASPARRAQAVRLWRRPLRAAGRFRSYAVTRGMGYDRFRLRWRRPQVFHVRDYALDGDGRVLDPARP